MSNDVREVVGTIANIADDTRRVWRDAKQLPTDSCWQCYAPLGTGPDNCLTCTAKRAENRAKEGRR